MVDAIVQYGAPCLRYLSVTRRQVMRCLPRLTGLEDLVVRRADVPVMKSFARASLQCADVQRFLPRLRRLYIYKTKEEESEDESEDDWVDKREEQQEFRQLRRLVLASFCPMPRRRRIEYDSENDCYRSDYSESEYGESEYSRSEYSESDSEDASADEGAGVARAFPSLEKLSVKQEKSEKKR